MEVSNLSYTDKLFGYIDGNIEAPNPIIRSTTDPPQVNPDYEQWHTKDQALITLINATLTQTALAYVVRCLTFREVWLKLEKHFSSSRRTNIVGLKSELQNISQKSIEFVDAYVQCIKDIFNLLAVVYVVINQEDLVIYAINGLPSTFNVFKTSLRTQSQYLTFEELHVLISSEERVIEQQIKADESSVPTLAMLANFSHFSNHGGGKGRGAGGRGRNSGRGPLLPVTNFSPQTPIPGGSFSNFSGGSNSLNLPSL